MAQWTREAEDRRRYLGRYLTPHQRRQLKLLAAQGVGGGWVRLADVDAAAIKVMGQRDAGGGDRGPRCGSEVTP